MHLLRSIYPILIAAAVTMPGMVLRLFHIELAPPMMALLSGAAILGASFILLWASDLAQVDISQTLALAVVALIVVLPEYAVDMYFTWQAGAHPESGYAHYAIANMTGANRLLIGVAWSMIAVLWWIKKRRDVRLQGERRTELLFLGMATVYAFVIPLKGSLAWYDGLALLAIYAWYMKIVSKRPCGECELEGPVECLARLPKARRCSVTCGLFLFAAVVILAQAGIFSEGLVATGRVFGINEFLLVQWLAPVASEAPEFIVAIMLTQRGQAGTALGSLLSAKLNQWTLLVGMIPGMYALSAGTFAHTIPMDLHQMHEVLLTAAQSLFGVLLLAGLSLSLPGAVVLLVLFSGQFLATALPDLGPLAAMGLTGDRIHVLFSFAYIALALAVALKRPVCLVRLRAGLRAE